MEDPSGFIFNYHEVESCDELRQKLLTMRVELESMRNVKRELLNLLKMAYQERDEARKELEKLVTKLTPASLFEIPPTMIPAVAPTKANSSITESNSPSHVSSPVDSFVEAVSPPENNLGYLKQKQKEKQPLVQNMSVPDVGNEVIEYLTKGKVLPQKGNLLKAVKDAGPLLQTLLVAGTLPTWRNPPPLHNINIKIPPLMLQDFGSNVALVNNSLQMTSNATCKNLAPSRIPPTHHYLLPN
ncbi:hypothetical protein VNO78_14223 [Psophocarpus tetragonolobus]|uniref:Uncharacterized protein n=1 Tax=Psophocarpus tetragonolobus TaxID=3891 RepID=A0AAN9SSW6_PSOTE